MLVAAQLTWYLTRGSGAVALLLLSISAVLGIIVTIGWGSGPLDRLVVNGLHRNVSLLITVFVVVHVLTAVLDKFVEVRWIDAFIPFIGTYRPVWLGLGAVAWDLILALIITSLARVRIGLPTWRAVHWFAYACLPIAALHALGTGSDVRSHWMVWLVAGCGVAVLASFAWRLVARRLPTQRATALAVTAAVVVPVVITAWLVTGPLRPGWGKS